MQIATLLAPLSRRLAEGEILALLAELGYRFPATVAVDAGLRAAVDACTAAGQQLGDAAVRVVDASDASDLLELASAVTALLTAVVSLRGAVDAMAAALSGAAAGELPAAELAALVAELPRRLVELGIVTVLEGQLDVLSGLLEVFGVIERREENVDSTDPLRPPFTRVQLRLDRLPAVLTSPAELAAQLYGWGTPAFDADAFFDRLASVLSRSGFPAFYDRTATPPALELVIAEATAAATLPEPGIALRLRTHLEETFEEEDATGLRWSGAARVRAPEGAELIVTPDGAVRLAAPGGSTTEGELRLRVDFQPGDPPDPVVVFGQQDGTRLQVSKVKFEAGVTLVWDGVAGASVGKAELAAAIERGALILAPPAGDGFLGRFVPSADDGSGAEFTLELGLRRTGFFIRGSAGLELAIPVHREIGPLTINEVLLAIRPDGSQLTGVVAAALRIQLGPVGVLVDRLGLRLETSFPETGGNLGPVQLDIALEPPTGAGLQIDAGPVAGSGFLSYDAAQGRYAGAISLEALDVMISALGVLDTRVPGAGFALTAIVTAQFTPVQLGLGFTLNGVGGLIGVNRTVNLGALRAAMAGPGLGGIFFPDDPLGQAERLVSDLAAFFPAADGRYLLGPAAKIGWGTPTIAEADLAVLLEVPHPVRLTLIGQVRAALPAQEAPLVVIKLDVVGTLDLEGLRLGFDAILRDSRVLTFPLEGQAALRLVWAFPPNYALAIGGFNPRFRPPPGFPTLPRIKIPVGFDDNPRIDIQGYLAFTSNSVQLGANAELYAEAFGLNVHGWVGFDTLFTFLPFRFTGDISGGVRLRRGTTVLAGVHLDATLTGPRPFRAWGEACLEIWLLPDLCVPFDVPWGDDEPIDVPARAIWPLLEAAVEDPRNWSGAPPVGALRVATLTAAEGTAETLFDPVGTITLRQTIVPLNREVTKFGEAVPEGPQRFDVTRVTLAGGAVTPSFVEDYFAPAQFEELSQDERLSRDSFERMASGFTAAGQTMAAGSSLGRALDYETIILDGGGRRPVGPYRPPLAAQLAELAVSAAAAAPLRTGGPRRFATPGAPAAVEDERFVVASAETLEMRPDLGAPGTRGAAEHALGRYLRAHPGDRGRLQVIPLHEARELA